MSGKKEARASITALTDQGYGSVQLTFSQDKAWPCLIWLQVTEDDAPESVGAIAKMVHRVDPGAVRI